MKTTKLTAKQAELLEALNSGSLKKIQYMRDMGRFNPNAYYYRDDNLARCTQAAARLLELGLVTRVNDSKFTSDHHRIKNANDPVS